MDKKSVLFIVVSVAIMSFSMWIYPTFIAPPPVVDPLAVENPVVPTSSQEVAAPVVGNNDGSLVDPTLPSDSFVPLYGDQIPANRRVTLRHELLDITFDSLGARVVSIKLPEHREKNVDGQPEVEMIVPSVRGGLITNFGGLNGQEMLHEFRVSRIDEAAGVVEFQLDYQRNDVPGSSFRVIKRYSLVPGEYVFQLDMEMVSADASAVPAPLGAHAYTLTLRPQIGPTSSQIGNYQDFRKFVWFDGNKKKNPPNASNGVSKVDDPMTWAALTGKYFSFIMVPNAAQYQVSFVTKTGEQLPENNLAFSRSLIQSSKSSDTFRFYVGPKLNENLSRFDRAADNNARLGSMKFTSLIDFDALGWLSNILKFIMQLFYNVVPNWGVTIILLTILVKLILFPLSRNSAESMARMQELNPKLQVLRDKYSDNPQKLNEETMALYQKEKINPLGGCLPMLLQLPFFFAMYSLFNNHFDLRGAEFIPGWINDLSQPESIFSFSQYFVIPFVNIGDIRLLPIIYVATQMISTKFTPSSAGAQSNAQMKFMMYGMPILFFFILYNTPSGLLVYWIFQNVLSVGQQIIVNRMVHGHKKSSPIALVK